MAAESLEVVSVEDDNGRVLSGVGVDAESLRETMDRHAPAETPAKSADAPAADTTAQPDEPKPSRGRRRIDDLTREREDEKRRADAAERERDDLKAKLAAAPAPRSEPQHPPVAAPVAQPAATRTKPTEDQVGTKYQTYADFVEDLSDWKAEQRIVALDFDARIRTSIEADRASRSHSAKVDEVLARGRKTYADFDAVLQAPHMIAGNWPGEKIQVIASLDQPEAIQYALAKDPVLAESLRTEPNLAKFGIRLAQLMTAAPVASPASTGLTSSVLPQPYQPVGSGSKTTVTPSAELAKKGFDFDKSGYREKRAAERGIRRMK